MDLENKPNMKGTRIGGGYMVVGYGSRGCIWIRIGNGIWIWIDGGIWIWIGGGIWIRIGDGIWSWIGGRKAVVVDGRGDDDGAVAV